MHKSNFLALSVLTVFLLFSVSCSQKQYDTKKKAPTEVKKKPEKKVLLTVDVLAQFPGGENNLMKWLSDNINYPTEAARQGIEGAVITRFVIEEKGNLSDIEIIKSSGNEFLDKEALRVISLMPAWIPAEQEGKKVAMYFSLPIRFKMPNRLPAEFVNPQTNK